MRINKGGEVKKAMAALLVFMLTSLKIVFERKKTVRGESSILAVTLFKNPALIYIFLTLAANRNLIKKISFKS